MAVHRVIIEMLRVSGSMFMLLCAASTICIVLLLLLAISFVRSLGRRAGNHDNPCERHI